MVHILLYFYLADEAYKQKHTIELVFLIFVIGHWFWNFLGQFKSLGKRNIDTLSGNERESFIHSHRNLFTQQLLPEPQHVPGSMPAP